MSNETIEQRFAIGPVAPGSENGGAAEPAGGREAARTDSQLTARVANADTGTYAASGGLGYVLPQDRYCPQPTGTSDEVPASMLKVHGRSIRHCETPS